MSEDCKNRGRKRSKAYYLKCAKQSRHKPCMEVGQQGFLITCNNRERDCTRETYSILNQYADELYGPEEPNDSKKEEDVLDVEEEVRREVESMKKMLRSERRFQAVDSGARNCIFITANVPNPSNFIYKILTDIRANQKQCSRFVLRITPVLSVCRANLDDIKSCAEKLLPEYFGETGVNGKTYAIVIKTRNNGTLSRDDIIPAIGSIITRLSPLNKADLSSPKMVVLVDIIGKLCCLGVAEDYYSLKKYNLAELTAKEKPSSTDTKIKCSEIKENNKDTITDESEPPKTPVDNESEPPEITATCESEPPKITATCESESSKNTDLGIDEES